MEEYPEAAGGALQTARLLLIPTSPAHAAGLLPLMRDERVSTYLAWAPHQSISETMSVISALADAMRNARGYHWTIFENGVVRGIISLIDVQRTHRLWVLDRAEVAYWIAADNHGRGLATEATDAVVAYAFDAIGLNRLRISHTSDNPASGRIPQKLGFRFIGTEHQFFKKNGVWHDMNHYELLADDWRARKDTN